MKLEPASLLFKKYAPANVPRRVPRRGAPGRRLDRRLSARHPRLSRASPTSSPARSPRSCPSPAPNTASPWKRSSKISASSSCPASRTGTIRASSAISRSPASGPGILGEMLAAALNVNHMLWKTGAVGHRAGAGHARLAAPMAGIAGGILRHHSRHRFHLHPARDHRRAGSWPRGGSGEAASRRAPPLGPVHLRARQSLRRPGRARRWASASSNIRHIAADDEFRMRPDALEAAIEADLAAGQKAVLRGSDARHHFVLQPRSAARDRRNRPALRSVAARRRRLRGSRRDARRISPHLDGAELADSLVVNPHKWLFTPVDLSALYTRRPEVLRRALRWTKRPRTCKARMQHWKPRSR